MGEIDVKNLSIISLDGHAQPSPEIWPEYLEKRYHEFLPGLVEENNWFSGIMRGFLDRTHHASKLEIFDADNAIKNGGTNGLWSRDIRLAEMDREGIAAEVITNGDPRFCGLFFQSSNQRYGQDLCQAGVKAYHRWVADEFGGDKDRMLLAGIAGCAPWRDLDELLREVDWLADNGYFATNLPGFTTYLHQPPLFDRYWDPLWARIVERGMVLYVHAGYGELQGEFGREVARLKRQIQRNGESLDSLAGKVNSEVFEDGAVFASIKPRRLMWQLMFAGVFDRFPGLKLVLSEVYGDWIPATMAYLDEVYEQNRATLPAKRKPSEYWADQCFCGLSFIRKCEVAVRNEVGVKTLGFGRDYPHSEGTWPNTAVWLHEAFKGVPGPEIEGILGGNFIDYMGWDAAKYAAIAARLNAPTLADILDERNAATPELLAHFDQRGRFLAEGEGASRVAEMSVLMREDLWHTHAAA
jgi:hypothetical protein